MPNNVETWMWLIPMNGNSLSDKEVEDFFSQFITVEIKAKKDEDPRRFDFNTIIPRPENIWLGDVGGNEEENLKEIEELGGLDVVRQALKEGKSFHDEMYPCLTDKQIKQFGMVNGLDWDREHWETKWNAYYCEFDWSARFGGQGAYQVAFCTAWNIPEEIIRKIRNKAVKKGYEIRCEFGGELDNPGVYAEGEFMYFEGKWNEEKEELERIGDPIDVHC
jgi:hypothetical protein